VVDVSFDTMVSDHECVVEAAGLDCFTFSALAELHGFDRLCHTPSREGLGHDPLWRLCQRLAGARRRRRNRREAVATLMRESWGKSNPRFRQAFLLHVHPRRRARTFRLDGRFDAADRVAGPRWAAGIPGARFFELESQSHILLEGEPAFDEFIAHVRAYVAETAGS